MYVACTSVCMGGCVIVSIEKELNTLSVYGGGGGVMIKETENFEKQAIEQHIFWFLSRGLSHFPLEKV